MQWSLLIHAIGLWMFFEVPFRIAFRPVDVWGLKYQIVGHVLDGMLLVDILVNMVTAFYNERSVLVFNLSEVHRHYMGTDFKLDLLAAFPTDLIVFVINMQKPHWDVLAWLRLPKMLRMVHIMAHRKRSEAQSSKGVFVTLRRLAPVLVCSIHLLACALWYIGRIVKQRVDGGQWYRGAAAAWFDEYQGLGTRDIFHSGKIVDQYLLSFFWVSMVISTTSLIGNMLPVNSIEIAYMVLLCVANLTLFSYLLGEISDAVMEQDEEKVEQRNRIMALQSFIVGRGLPSDLAREVRQHFTFVVTSRDQGDAADIFSLLSHSLQVDVARSLSRGLLAQVAAFRQSEDRFLDAVAVLLREQIISPEQYIFQTNEVSKMLYIVSAGRVEQTIVQDDEEVVESARGPAELVGEVGFFFGVRQSCNARAAAGGVCQLFTLLRTDYQQVAKLFPDEDEQVTRLALTSNNAGDEEENGRGTSEAGTSFAGSSTNRSSLADASAIDDLHTVRRTLDLARRKKRNDRIAAMLSHVAKNQLDEVKRSFQLQQARLGATPRPCPAAPRSALREPTRRRR